MIMTLKCEHGIYGSGHQMTGRQKLTWRDVIQIHEGDMGREMKHTTEKLELYSCCMQVERPLHILTFHFILIRLHVLQLFQQLASFLPGQRDICSRACTARHSRMEYHDTDKSVYPVQNIKVF